MLIPGGFSDGTTPRLRRRAEPRFVIMLAAAGALVAITGPLLIGGDQLDTVDLGRSQFPGVLLTVAMVVVGYGLMLRIGNGPLATAGSMAVVAGVPSAMYFLTVGGGDVLGEPSMEAILSISAAVFVISWAVGPARGRPVFLGVGLLAGWLFVLQVIDGTIDILPGAAFSVTVFIPDTGTPPTPDFDPTTNGLISLAFGAAYLVLARLWDRDGAHGAATAPAAVGLLAVASGVGMVAIEFEPASTGFLLMAIGLALAVNGANAGRRATTWLGGFAVAGGAALIVADTLDSAMSAGIGFVVVGVAVAAVADQARDVVPEPEEVGESSERMRARPAPRLLTTGGAVGGVLVATGATVIGIDAVSSDGGTGSRIPGIVTAVGLVVVGYLLLWQGGHRPRASAGSVAALVGVPALVFFVTFDVEARTFFSVIGLLVVAVAAWLPTWFWSKRPLYLGAAAFAVWLLVLELVEDALSFIVSGDFFELFFAFFSEPDVDVPEPTTLGIVSFVVGAGLLAGAVLWDRHGNAGAATPLVAPAVVALYMAVTFLADDVGETGAGLAFVAVGCALALAGARGVGRRFLAWSGAASITIGVEIVIGEHLTSATTAGLAAIAVGSGLVVAAHALSTQNVEPDEMEPRPGPQPAPGAVPPSPSTAPGPERPAAT